MFSLCKFYLGYQRGSVSSEISTLMCRPPFVQWVSGSTVVRATVQSSGLFCVLGHSRILTLLFLQLSPPICGLGWGCVHILSTSWPWKIVCRGKPPGFLLLRLACSTLDRRLGNEDFSKNLFGSQSKPLISLLVKNWVVGGGSVSHVFCTSFYQSWGPFKAGILAYLCRFCQWYFRHTFAEFIWMVKATTTFFWERSYW